MEKDYLRVHIGTVSTNQHALDFEGNKKRIFRSIEICKSMGCTYRAGSECEVSGYSCEDHFKELDTIHHSWEVVSDLLATDLTDGIVVEMNMPVIHRSICYDCKVLCLNRKILFVRPKTELCDEGVYKESRYFVSYNLTKELDEFVLPSVIQSLTGQETCPFGVALIQALDCTFGLEIGQELNALSNSPGKMAFVNNADFIVNSSALHYEAELFKQRFESVNTLTNKNGGAYIFVNAIGCDGTNLYMSGGNLVSQNGIPLSLGNYHTLNEIEISTAVLNLQKVRLKRQGHITSQRMNLNAPKIPSIDLNFKLCTIGIKFS